MEVVKAFNDELFSINEIRGPVSRAKMAKITSSAIKAVRFYKHVVQSVEKFIQKGGADQKIPGLYVMDSIIRHSIHHFGSEKDVFAQRFAKNLLSTFQHLLQCKEDEKVKVVRVLQLWQKNSVFPKELIQQLLELIEKSSDSISSNTSASPSSSAAQGGDNSTSDEPQQPQPASSSQNELMSTFLQLLQSQSDKGFQINQLLQQVASSHPQLLPQLTQVVQLSQNQNSNSNDNPLQPAPPPTSVHQPPQPVPAPPPVQNPSGNTGSLLSGLSSRLSNAFDSRSATAENNSNNDKCSGHSSTAHGWTSSSASQQDNSGSGAFGSYDYSKQYSSNHGKEDAQYGHQSKYIEREEGEMWEDEAVIETSRQDEEEEYHRRTAVSDHHWNRMPATGNDRKRRRSRERSRRSRSREKRRRSQSNERSFRSDSREKYSERVKGEMERVRRHLGLPMIDLNHVLICSTTLWLGHLNKHTTEHELRSELANYGTVTSMNLIPPRGCAYVTFSSRKDACKALERMKGTKFLNNVLKVAWAIGTGMKESVYKEFWNLEQGSFSIPWDKLDESVDFDALSEGGYLDEASLSSDLSKCLTERREKKAKENARPPVDGRTTSTENDANPPLPPSVPQCFPPPPPLPIPPPGMPPFMPPSGLMMGMPPIIMPPGMINNPVGVLSPGRGSAPGQISSSMPVNPPPATSNASAVPPFFPPMPPMWGPHQPPLPFPPSAPMRHPQPLQQPPMGNFLHDQIAEPFDENFGNDMTPKFKPNFPQSGSPFRAALRPPLMGNSRGGHRPPPLPLPKPSALNYTADTEEEYYEECEPEDVNAFTPNRRFGPPPPPRFGRDPPQFFRGNQRRGRNNWNPNMGGFRGRGRMNAPPWGANMEVPQFGEEEYQEGCEEENGEYFEEPQFPADDWIADEGEIQEDFAFHGPPGRWGQERMGPPPPPQWWRNEEPPFPPPMRGFQRGGNRWNNNRSRGFQKWGRGNKTWEQPQGNEFVEPEWNQESEADGGFAASWGKESEHDNTHAGRWGPESNAGPHWGNEGEPDTSARWNKTDSKFTNNGSQNNSRGAKNRHRGSHNTSRWTENFAGKDPVVEKRPDSKSLVVEPSIVGAEAHVVDDNSATEQNNSNDNNNESTITDCQPPVEEKSECSLTGDASVSES